VRSCGLNLLFSKYSQIFVTWREIFPCSTEKMSRWLGKNKIQRDILDLKFSKFFINIFCLFLLIHNVLRSVVTSKREGFRK
jgi:hypothetical protein